MNPGSTITGSDGVTYYITTEEHLNKASAPSGVSFEVDEEVGEVILIADGAEPGTGFRVTPSVRRPVKSTAAKLPG